MNFVDEILSCYSPIIQSIFYRVQKEIQTAVPDAKEELVANGKEIGYFIPGKGCVIKVVPMKYSVRLYFAPNLHVSDPQLLFNKIGKRTEYIDIQTMVVATSPVLKKMFQEAWMEAIQQKPRNS